ncbi:unnamed protein product [Lactuca saligna]|uniref:Uncharacterized protein n=1 Tax=Lactuca saligna TaxID=75948 RepID=A0AA36E6T2_LACSI|nr:unnamed protein product [Lactuca saligna]
MEALLALTIVGPAPKCEAPYIVARVEVGSLFKGSSVPSLQVVSHRLSDVADSTLWEDVGGDTIGGHLSRKRNINPFTATSPIAIYISDGDKFSASNLVYSHRQWKKNAAGACDTSPSASDNERSKVAPVLSYGSGSNLSESGVVAQSTDAMDATIRAFAKTHIASYLRLGELGLTDLRQLYSQEEDTVLDDDMESDV